MEVKLNNQLPEGLGIVRLNTVTGPFFLPVGPQSTGDLMVPSQVISIDIYGQTVVSPDPGPVVLPDGRSARLNWKGDQNIEIITVDEWTA